MQPDSGNEMGRRIQAVRTATEIISALWELDGAGITELANHTGLAKSVVYNYLMTFLDLELVERDGDEFRISLRFLELGQYARLSLDIYEYSKEEMKELADETDAAVHLIVEQHGVGYVVNQAQSSGAVATSTRVGHTVALPQTAAGKAILASLPEDRLEEILATYEFPRETENTITSKDDLLEELAEVRETGVAFADEELLHGFRAVGAPVTDSVGEVLGAISVSGPTAQLADGFFNEELPQLVLQKSNYIESKISASEKNYDAA